MVKECTNYYPPRLEKLLGFTLLLKIHLNYPRRKLKKICSSEMVNIEDFKKKLFNYAHLERRRPP